MLSDGGRTAETLLNLSNLPEICSLETSRPKYTNVQLPSTLMHQVARETLKINHFSVFTDEVVLALFCVIYKTIIHLGVGESGVI